MVRGDILYVNLPLVSGHRAQGGRRPAILLSADTALRGNSMAMIVPLTSNMVATRFPFTFKIESSLENGLFVPSVALVFQLCAADRTHIDTVLGHVESQHLTKIAEMLRLMLDL